MMKFKFALALVLICIGWSFLYSFRLEAIGGSVFVASGAYLIVDIFYFSRER